MYKILISFFISFPLLAISNGDMAPDFTLTNHKGEKVSLSDFKGKHVVLEWFNQGCPFVRKHYDVSNMQKIQKKYGKDVVWLTINSSAEGKQGHLASAKAAKQTFLKESMASKFLLLDAPGKVGRLYAAKTTPHMFLIDPAGKLAYQGAIDSIPSASSKDVDKATNYVVQAIEDSKAGRKIAQAKTAPYGCSVKY